MSALEVRWLSVFADVPADQFAAARSFWTSVTDTTAGRPEGEQGEFTPLEPRDGDRFVWLQRVTDGAGGWHPDLHVPDPAQAAEEAVALGASELRTRDDLVVLATPAGQPFCVVRDAATRPRRRPRPPRWDNRRSLADQLCLDVPADRFDTELTFWTALTGWSRRRTDAPEFERLNPPDALPVQFLLQRLGTDDAGGARAHLDLSADDRAAEAQRHEGLGAQVVRCTDDWTTLRDPAGLVYCVTRRVPGHRPG